MDAADVAAAAAAATAVAAAAAVYLTKKKRRDKLRQPVDDVNDLIARRKRVGRTPTIDEKSPSSRRKVRDVFPNSESRLLPRVARDRDAAIIFHYQRLPQASQAKKCHERVCGTIGKAPPHILRMYKVRKRMQFYPAVFTPEKRKFDGFLHYME